MIKSVSLLLVFGASAGVGVAASHIQASQAVEASAFVPFARASAAPSDPAESHAAPPASMLSVELEPVGVNKTSAGESLVLELEVAADRVDVARARYAFELVDDIGTEVVPATHSEIFAVGKDAASTFRLTTPPLADGFYVARATVVAEAGGDHDGAVRQVWIEARGGDVNPVDGDIFHQRSRASQGHR